MCALYRLPVAKQHNFGPIWTFGDSCTKPLLTDEGQIVVLKQSQGLHLHARFHLNVFTVSNFDFWEFLYRPLLLLRVKFGVLEQSQALHLHAKFHLNVFTLSASGGQKLQF